MKTETEGYFAIKFKRKEKYVSDDICCCYTNLVEDARPFETKTEAYEYMKRYSLDKECIIVKVKKLTLWVTRSIKL